MLNMDEVQFTFVPGRSTTDAISIVGLQQEMYMTAANKKAIVCLRRPWEAFDRVPRKVLWWALRSLGVD